MHVDHILPTNKADINDEEVKQYIEEWFRKVPSAGLKSGGSH